MGGETRVDYIEASNQGAGIDCRIKSTATRLRWYLILILIESAMTVYHLFGFVIEWYDHRMKSRLTPKVLMMSACSRVPASGTRRLADALHYPRRTLRVCCMIFGCGTYYCDISVACYNALIVFLYCVRSKKMVKSMVDVVRHIKLAI